MIRTFILLLIAICTNSFSNELHFTKMKECEFNPDALDFTTACANIENKNSKIIINAKSKIIELNVGSSYETFIISECYFEEFDVDTQTCNGSNSAGDDMVIYINQKLVVILEPEFKSIVLF